MCGSDSSIRIEGADNGVVVDAYTPGDGNKPGRHVRKVAMTEDQAISALRPHLSKVMKGNKGRKMRGGENGTSVRTVQYGKSPKKGRKRGTRKRG